jgi:CubicO group peptidase (beta-lactamase class C family)
MHGNFRFVSHVGLSIFMGMFALPLLAQSPAPNVDAASVANDPDVLGAERLFSAWIEGQIAYRGLPGVAIGVVSNQDLVWSKGFGFADVKAKLPMTAAT